MLRKKVKDSFQKGISDRSPDSLNPKSCVTSWGEFFRGVPWKSEGGRLREWESIAHEQPQPRPQASVLGALNLKPEPYTLKPAFSMNIKLTMRLHEQKSIFSGSHALLGVSAWGPARTAVPFRDLGQQGDGTCAFQLHETAINTHHLQQKPEQKKAESATAFFAAKVSHPGYTAAAQLHFS